MDVGFIRERITKLRIEKGVSEYKMSYDLGHSRGYINNISSGKVLPSMAEFLSICDYFHMTPSEFFCEGEHNPNEVNDVFVMLNSLSKADFQLVLQLISRLQNSARSGENRQGKDFALR